jgi:hypothetical protein
MNYVGIDHHRQYSHMTHDVDGSGRPGAPIGPGLLYSPSDSAGSLLPILSSLLSSPSNKISPNFHSLLKIKAANVKR